MTHQPFPHLFSPLAIGGATVKNRIFSTGHMTMMGADDNPTESLAAYHEARAAGGAGLIVTEAAAVHPSTTPMHIVAFRGDCIPFRRFVFPLLMLWTAPATGIAMCHIAVIMVR
ncbi:MAG: hypothetical protein V3S40_11245 [Kiloniellales bacterium]